jgi:hypothetical protein
MSKDDKVRVELCADRLSDALSDSCADLETYKKMIAIANGQLRSIGLELQFAAPAVPKKPWYQGPCPNHPDGPACKCIW